MMRASNRLIEAINKVEQIMIEENIDPTKGLPEELFLFGTTLMPVSNVDLFITNVKGQVLLSWRNDIYYGKGWHIPGGCIRLRETWLERIQKTALNEIRTEVEVKLDPIVVRESMTMQPRPWLKNQLERTHNTSILFDCKVLENFTIDNGKLQPGNEGFIKWFDSVPADLLQCHKELYGDVLNNWFREKRFL